jgi:hypothetical protein
MLWKIRRVSPSCANKLAVQSAKGITFVLVGYVASGRSTRGVNITQPDDFHLPSGCVS